jgi:hypothetical protein
MRATRHAPEPQEDEVTLTMTVTEAQHLRRTLALALVNVTDEARATVCDAYDALYALETQPARVAAQAKGSRA